MTKTLKLGFFLLFIIQIYVASNFELAHDEAYYWIFSKHLDWGYFDHPPIMALTIKLFSFLSHSELAVRLGFILMQFSALVLLLTIIPASQSLIASLLFFSFPLASFTGLLALPDMPLLFFSALYCVILKRYLEKNDLLSTLFLSVCIPLLLYAKYHGILLIFFTLLAVPKLLLRKSFYLITLISILLFLPHLWWQYTHGFSTLVYHFVERPSSTFSFKRCIEYLGTQVALAGVFVGPIVWWISWKFKALNSFDRVMKFMAFGILIFFLISTFSKKVEANWTISLAIPLIYLSARSEIWDKKRVSYLLSFSFGLVLIARFLFIVPTDWVRLKRLSEFHGWEKWSIELKKICGDDRKLIANTYQIASKLSFYLNEEIQALNYHSRKNQFDYWRFDRSYITDNVCYITDKSEFAGEQITTPDGKNLKIVRDLKLSELQELRAEEVKQWKAGQI